MNRLKNESGQALVLVMMVMLLLLLMGSSMLTQGSESRKQSYEERKMVQAYYIADAGAEKALARIKNDPFWLKEDLAYNTEVRYIGDPDGVLISEPLAYMDGGQITDVTVKRTSVAANPTTFYIKSLGEYQGARRTIEIEGKMYDPVNLPAGVTVNFPSTFSNNTIINSDVISTNDLTFSNNSNISGVITAVGNVMLQNNVSATKVVTGGDLILSNNVQVTMDVEAARDVILYNNVKITGNINAVRNVSLGNNAVITGDVYYNGTLTMGSGALIGEEMLHPGEAHAVNVVPAPFPVLDQDWYARNADRVLTGNLAGSFDVDGISYVAGDISLSGTYSGNGAIVAGGKVTINGDLNRADAGSSLAVISFGNDDGVGIEVSKNITVYALLYCPNKIVIDNNANFHGSVICNVVDVSNNATVTYEDFLQQNQPDWITTGVSITSWKEQYSVF
ncbi:MAG: Polymer-forming cytoskeletal [Pelotomaculum sp. PtaB.Bin104]|nr:MAG: Polymer-forming cytoskeletal [Pelotomaculum sp. PtaB.Bin104]